MKAKKVYESIEDILRPKNEEEIQEAFRERHKMSWEKYKKYAEELESHGVEILELYSLSINEMTIKVYAVFSGNWEIGKVLTKRDAMAMIQTHKQYSYEQHDYHISEDHAYLYPSTVRDLVFRLRMGIKQSPEFHDANYGGTTIKWDNPEYIAWRESPEGKVVRDRELQQWINREKERKIDEGIENILKPKSKEEIEKNWPEDWDVTSKQFLNTWKQLKNLGVNIIGTQTAIRFETGDNDDGRKQFRRSLEYIVYGFYVFRGNNGIIRVLTEKDAKKLSDAMKNLDYTKQEYSYRPEKIFLDYLEARNYVLKKPRPAHSFRRRN